ncbi:unnamed protein product, partial [Schistosoma curassoni]
MTEQIPFQRTSTIKHRISRTGSIGQDHNNNNTTGNMMITSGINNSGIQHQQSSIRRPSIMQKYMGEIEFTGLNQTARFCKLNSDTPDSVLRDILKRKWGLKPPTLIITVFGTDFEKKRKLKMIFKKGLWKAAESGCWIVTGGFHLGVMKLTGEAVRDYTDAYGGNRMMAFGVASWDCVTKNEILEAALHEGTAVYQSEEDEEEEAEDSEPILIDPLSQSGLKSVRSDIEERALDPNHNFFVLVDDGTTDQLKGKEAELRARFERCISLWNCASSPQEQTTTATSPQSGPISSTTHLQQQQQQQQPQNGISTPSNINNNVNSVGLQRQGSTMGGQVSTTSGPQTSATSIGKNSGITGGSTSNSALSKGASEPIVSNQPNSTVSVTRGAKDKLTTESSLKPAKSGKSVGSEEEILVPMCGLVVGGDRFTLRQVYCSMIRNRCPIVVTKGTSGAADVLAFGLDAANKMASEEVVDDKDQVPLEARLESIIEEFLGDLHPDYTNYTDEVNMLCEIINDYTNLVSVFDMEEDSDLDGYVISSLLASAGTTVTTDQINLEQLEITLTLNRADIAREKIFLENKKWKKGQLNDYMYQALMSDRHDFVKLFLEQGFSLEDFLTIYMLEKLYTDQLKNLNSKVAIFNKMWEYNRSHRTSKVALRDVGKVIKALVGDFYHPLYLSKEFQAKLMPEKRLEGADICQRLLGSHKLRNSQDNSHLSSSSSSINNNNHNHNGAICPRTLGLRDSVRFIDYGEDYDYMNLHNVHTSSLPSAPPPPATTTTTIEDIGFRNPAFLECDKYGSRNKHGRRSSSQTNEHDMLIPGQPLIYNATVTNVSRSGHGSRGPYTSLGPGHFRIAGKAPLAYDTTSMGTTTPIQSPKPAINDTLQFSFDNEHVQRNSVLISPIQNEKSIKPVLFEDEANNKPSRSCFMSCIQKISSFCSRLFRCNTDSKKSNKSLNVSQEPSGIKGPKEFATLRAMAALAAATAATAVADPTKTSPGDEEQTKSIQLDRPARELLIWSILVGKLRMAELFWTMEKEPIAAALLASILLTSLGNKTDDFTDKEDYRSFAKNFQERAEGVLNECYREDEHRTQLIINHELIYYGRSSVIKLAAEGQSIKFMAHPCCQDFLTNTWSGNLSTKNSVFRYIMGVVCGLTLPFLIPKVILSKPKTIPTTEGEESSPTSEQQGSTQ